MTKIEKIIDRILMSVMFFERKTKPGEMLEIIKRNLSDEEKDLLKNATSNDWNHRYQ